MVRFFWIFEIVKKLRKPSSERAQKENRSSSPQEIVSKCIGDGLLQSTKSSQGGWGIYPKDWNAKGKQISMNSITSRCHSLWASWLDTAFWDNVCIRQLSLFDTSHYKKPALLVLISWSLSNLLT